jgi:hypothetical protein
MWVVQAADGYDDHVESDVLVYLFLQIQWLHMFQRPLPGALFHAEFP